MCGIIGGKGAGTFESVEVDLHLLSRRGPDQQKFIRLDNGFTFGAARLAMTDPHERSHQPMLDIDNGNLIVFNGEIYNYKKIKENLKKENITFETESDTEVLLKSLSFYGKAIIPKLEGMFAFVFFDKKNNEIIMARDYLGKKPLYYYLTKSSFFFSSQIKLIRNFIRQSDLDYAAMATYLQLGYVVDPKTMYREISAVGPGEILIIEPNQLLIKIQEYYIPQAIQLSQTSDISINMQEALRERTEGHDKFALSLSGGVDSTILAIECAKMNLPVSAYSMRWSDSDKDKYNIDSDYAEKIAHKLGIKFTSVEMPNVVKIPEILDTYVNAMEEPNANPTGLSMMALYSKMGVDGHRLVLTGDGADEVFGGYPRYKLAKKYELMPQINSRTLARIICERDQKNRLLSKIAAALVPSKSDEYWLFWHLIAGRKDLYKLMPDLKISNIKILGLELETIFGTGRLPNLMYRDLRTWLSMESNRKLDRISMWNSIEARSPFQSENIIYSGYKNMAINKFKRSQKEILLIQYPELKSMPINAQKSGFISPLGYWLRNNPILIQEAIDGLPSFLPLNKNELLKLSKSPQNRVFGEMKILWSLIVLYRWLAQSK
jgi:asparagine synthase (glutamine-hydrolysing)